ncbi:MAG TPA: hypothetical protein VJ697_15600 [Nitrososphaeraceae archaeon]|nr:hypothetical protein [Nitrososphaeraceae archaeon]
MEKILAVIPSIILLIILFFSFVFNIKYIYGHTEIQVGNYTIEAGWNIEPPLLNNLNSIVISVFENDNPVRNAMKDLTISVNYGGLSKNLNFIPSEEGPGQYLATIIPSQLGSYTINLKGMIGTQNISNDIQIEDIEDSKKLTFPTVTEGTGENMENIAKQITPLMKDLSTRIDQTTQEINATKEVMKELSEENDSIMSELERTSILSYIATGLGASAIILVGVMQRIKKN